MSNILKYQNPSSPLLIQRVNESNANFVKRLLDPNRKSIQNWVNPLSISTHKLGWATEDTKQGAFVYPEVQEINGELIDFTHPSHRRSEGMNSAIERRDTVRMTPEQAKWFTENYKQYYPSFKKGGRIHIKKKNRGSFTRWCKGKVTAECIARGKRSKNPKIRKKATFAANVRKWKHKNGGNIMVPDIIKFFNGGGIPMFQNSGKIYQDWQKELAIRDYEDQYNRGEVYGPVPNYDFKNRNTESVFLPYMGFSEQNYNEQKQSNNYSYRNSSDSFYNDDFVYNRLNHSDNTPSHVFENDGKSNIRRIMFYYPKEQGVQNDTIIERNGVTFRRQNLPKEDWEHLNKYMDSRRMEAFLK